MHLPFRNTPFHQRKKQFFNLSSNHDKNPFSGSLWCKPKESFPDIFSITSFQFSAPAVFIEAPHWSDTNRWWADWNLPWPLETGNLGACFPDSWLYWDGGQAKNILAWLTRENRKWCSVENTREFTTFEILFSREIYHRSQQTPGNV